MRRSISAASLAVLTSSGAAVRRTRYCSSKKGLPAETFGFRPERNSAVELPLRPGGATGSRGFYSACDSERVRDPVSPLILVVRKGISRVKRGWPAPVSSPPQVSAPTDGGTGGYDVNAAARFKQTPQYRRR